MPARLKAGPPGAHGHTRRAPTFAHIVPFLLRRRTTSLAYIPEVDGIRFVAIAMVFLDHLFFRFCIAWAEAGNSPAGAELTLPFRLHNVLANGYKGVYLFFMLSGFILALPFARSRLGGGTPIRVKDYYLRRILRIEPPYLIAILLLYALWQWVEGPAAPDAAHLSATLGYVHGAIYNTASPINIVAWTLEVEVQFYLLAPLLFTVFFLRSRTLRITILIAAMMCTAGAAELWKPQWLILFPYLPYFFGGILLADIYVVAPRRDAQPARAWLVFPAAILFAAILAAPLLGAAGYRLIFPALIFSFFVCIAGSGSLRKLFSIPLFTTIGGMCYSIYLLHYALMKWLFPHTIGWRIGDEMIPNLILQGLLYTALVLVVSTTYFIVVERPFMGWRRQNNAV